LDLSGSEQGRFEHGNEPKTSIKSGEFPEQLRSCCVLTNDSAPWSW